MENVSLSLSRLEFFWKYKNSLKKVRVTLWRTDALHHCNRLLVCVLRKDAPILCNVWNFGIKERKVRLNSCRTDFLYYYNRLLIGLNLNLDSIHLGFFTPLKEVRLNSCGSGVLYYYNRVLMESHLNFHKILMHELSSLMEHFSNLMSYPEFFWKNKQGLKASESYFI